MIRFPATLGLSLLTASSLIWVAPVMAQAPSAPQRWDLPAAPLGETLNRIASAGGRTVSVDPQLIAGLIASPVRGEWTVEQAFDQALAGSGLVRDATSSGVLTLRREPQGEGAMQLPAVRVEATAELGTSTEGSGSYTTRAVAIGKTVTSLRETPQSVTVISRQRLDDQNLVELTEAMKYVPGVIVRRQSSTGNRSDIYARGYQASTYQLDGVNTHNNPATIESLDLALFDRVEALRGPAGLFSGAGEPGVTINLARKRALTPFQVQGAIGAGSWERFRAEVDVTGALTASGRLRGRAVAVAEDFGSYLDGVEGDKQVAYGTLEYDVLTNSTLSTGGTWQQSAGFYDTGLPAYADGRLAPVPRSTAVVADWTTAEPESLDGFIEWETRRADGGVFKVALRSQDRTQRDLYINAYGAVQDDGTSRFTQAQGVGRDYDDMTLDVFFSRPFTAWGFTHNLLVGADYRKSDQLTDLMRGVLDSTVDLFNYDPGSVPRPELSPFWNNLARVESSGVYGQLRVKPMAPLTVVLGGRLSQWESRSFVRPAGTASSFDANNEFTPFGAVLFDVNASLTTYASYAEIFQPQNNLQVGGQQIEPRTGGQWELGLKGEFVDGRVNASAAVFRIDDESRALADPDNTGFFIAAGKVRSEGFEAELSGELTPRLRANAGYAYIRTEYLTGTATQTGQAFSTFTPRHNANLWLHYRLPELAGRALELGAGVRAVSDFYTESGAVRWNGAGYAVGALKLGYQLSERYHAALNVENLLDKTYWERVENGLRSNYYGAPRSFMVTLRGQFGRS